MPTLRWLRAVRRHRRRLLRRRRYTSRIRPSENSPVVHNSHGAQPNIDIREGYRKEAAPRPAHVVAIKTARAVVSGLAEERLLDLIFSSANQMPHRVATQRVA